LTEPVRAITIRGLRIVWRVLLLATVVYVWVAERHHPTAKQISRACYIAICVVSICVICTMFLVRKLSAKRLATSSHPADPKTLRRAYADQLLLMGCSLAVVLYGLVVRFTGATLGQALPFYVVGLCATSLLQAKGDRRRFEVNGDPIPVGLSSPVSMSPDTLNQKLCPISLPNLWRARARGRSPS
jgi:hypothetical protein